MIEIKIPKEINRYEAKFIGPFTMRQSVCLLIALPACVLLYNALKQYMPMDSVGVVCLLPASIAYLFGWFKPYGMKFEKFLQNVFISAFVAPSKRKYCTNNFYANIAKQIREAEVEAAKEAETAKGKRKNKTKKYRRSKSAIK